MLDKGQIKHITKVIQSKQIRSFLLEEELIDFVSCSVENHVAKGMHFDEALEYVLKGIETQGIAKLQKITTNSAKPNSIDMFQNYFKIAIRNFVKHRANSMVNVTGLILGLSSVLIIGLYVSHELSYDKSYTDLDRIYRVNSISHMGDVPRHMDSTSPLLVEAMLDDIPEVELATGELTSTISGPKKINDRSYFDIRVVYYHRTLFDIFGFTVVEGDLSTVYKEPYNVVVSESFASRYFGSESPIHKTIEAEKDGKKVTFTITAVFEGVPENSHFSEGWNKMDVIGSNQTVSILSSRKPQWNSTHGQTYIKISQNSNPTDVELKINQMLRKRAGEEIWYEHYLQPVADIHLNPQNLEIGSEGDISQVITFGLIGVLILMIACINYINLATARITIRMKEVGVRKVLGAARNQFLSQFIIEAFVLTITSMVVSLILVGISLDYVNTTFDLSLSLSFFRNIGLLSGLFLVLFLVSIFSGGYPGLYLSRIKSISLLKSTLVPRGGKFSMRKVLVVFQFGISAAIIVCTILVVKQLDFVRNSDLGYDKENIVYVPMPYSEVKVKGKLFRDALNKLPEVESVSLTGGSLATGNMSGNGIRFLNSEKYSMQRVLPVDFGYMNTMGFQLNEGRWFDETIATDAATGFVVNEAFLKYFDIEEPIGMVMGRNSQKGQIIGVAKDFHWKSMHSEIEPLVMYMNKEYAGGYSSLVLKLNSANLLEVHDKLEAVWSDFFGERPFEWNFLDEQLERSYRKEKVFGDIFSSFSLIAIAISSLGLLGLVSFSVERRLKEIGVRKVLGASVSSILVLVSRDFSKLILAGFVLSIPAAYFFITKWLENFEYRIDVGYEPFLLACLLTVLIAWASVSYISLKAAKSNPADVLRSE